MLYIDAIKPYTPKPSNPPAYFLDKLEYEFRGRLRIRWSVRDGQWHIEQRTGNNGDTYKGVKQRVDEWYDELVRQRDGYTLVMKVAHAGRIPCVECREALQVPSLESMKISCAKCRTTLPMFSGYWPLGELLLEHLKSIDPERAKFNILERAKRMDTQNAVNIARKEQALVSEAKWGIFDALLEQRPSSLRPA